MQTTHAEGGRSETSWLQCNWRILKEALDTRRPLPERVKFLAIFAKNLDEFFMTRVSALLRQVTEGVLEVPFADLRPSEKLIAIRQAVMVHLTQYAECWHHDMLPQLHAAGIHILHYRELQPKQRAFVAQYFAREIFPMLTPLALDPTHPFPYISHLSLNLAVVVNDPLRGACFARVKVEDVFPRLVRIPDEDRAERCDETGLTEMVDRNFVWLEEVIATHMDMLFPGLQVVAVYPFRVTRDAGLQFQDDAAADLLTVVEERVGMRHFGSVVRLEVDRTMPEAIREVLMRHLRLAPSQVYTVEAPLGIAALTPGAPL